MNSSNTDVTCPNEKRKNLLRRILSSIDHKKRKSFCSGFVVVYDKTFVSSKIETLEGEIPSEANVGIGPAYFNRERLSPLVRVCAHKRCMPNADLLYLVVKSLNVDGVAGIAPIAVRFENLEWKTHTGKHRGGEVFINSVKNMWSKYRYGPTEDNGYYAARLLKTFLFVARRMPFVDAHNSKFASDYINEAGWNRRLRSIDTNEKYIDEIVNNTTDQYGSLMWNPIKDALVEDIESSKYAMYTLLDSWTLLLSKMKTVPLPFYAFPRTFPEPVDMEDVYFDRSYYDFVDTLTKFMHEAPINRESNKRFYQNLYETVSAAKITIGMKDEDTKIYPIKYKLELNDSVVCIQDWTMKSEFRFPVNMLSNLIKEIGKCFVFSTKNPERIKKEMDYIIHYMGYLNGEKHSPNHDCDESFEPEVVTKNAPSTIFMKKNFPPTADITCKFLHSMYYNHMMRLNNRLDSGDQYFEFRYTETPLVLEKLLILREECLSKLLIDDFSDNLALLLASLAHRRSKLCKRLDFEILSIEM